MGSMALQFVTVHGMLQNKKIYAWMIRKYYRYSRCQMWRKVETLPKIRKCIKMNPLQFHLFLDDYFLLLLEEFPSLLRRCQCSDILSNLLAHLLGKFGTTQSVNKIHERILHILCYDPFSLPER